MEQEPEIQEEAARHHLKNSSHAHVRSKSHRLMHVLLLVIVFGSGIILGKYGGLLYNFRPRVQASPAPEASVLRSSPQQLFAEIKDQSV